MTELNYPFPKMIIFDWDNTLTDTFPAVNKALNTMHRAFDLPLISLDDMKKDKGGSLRDTFPEKFGDRWLEAKDIYLNAYKSIHMEMLCPFDGIFESLQEIKQQVEYLVVISNKTGDILRQEVKKLGWESLFHTVIGAGDCPHDKPAVDPVLSAIKGTDIVYKEGKLSECVWFVGDGDADIECAQNTSCYPIRIAQENKDGIHVLTLKSCNDLRCFLYSCNKKR